MKYTIDTYTGKKFPYDMTIITMPNNRAKSPKIVTVGRFSRRENRYISLNPSRLPKELFDKLNPNLEVVK